MNRIKNTVDGAVPKMDVAEALKLLRVTHVGEDGVLPFFEAREVLYAAFPHCISLDSNGERRVNHRMLLDSVLLEFVPAYQTGKAQGRPSKKSTDLHSIVERQKSAGAATTIKAAIYNAVKEGQLPDQPSSRSTYYRDKKAKQSQSE